MKKALFPALVALLASGTALADRTEYSSGVQAIEITSPLSLPPIVVKNVSNDRTVDGRDLRVVSATSMPLNVRGSIACAHLGPSVRNPVRAAQVMFGNPLLMQGSIYDLMVPDEHKSERIEFPAPGSISKSVDIDAAYPVPATWLKGTLITLFFSPVKNVEDQLDLYVKNGGRAIDFLRSDAVFEDTIQVSLVGWCGEAERAGFRQVDLVARVFYQGDPSLVDSPAVGQGGAGQISAPEVSRARTRVAPAQGSEGSGPPARTTPPRPPRAPVAAPRREDAPATPPRREDAPAPPPRRED